MIIWHGTADAPGPAQRIPPGRVVALVIGTLPIEQRRVLELRLIGLNDREIGEVLDRSRGSVRVLQHRAIARLRSVLGVGASPMGASDAEG